MISILKQKDYGNGWVNSLLFTMSYNTAGLLEEKVTQSYDSGNWVDLNKSIRSYYASGEDKQQLDFEWGFAQQAWIETGRDSSDEEGKTLYRIIKYYDQQDEEFYGGFFFQYTYDNGGLLTEIETDQLVYGTQNEWENYNLSTYTYDANGQTQEVITKKWDANIGDYVNHTRTYNFNTGCLFNSARTTEAKQAACYHSNPINLGQPIYCTSFDSNEELSLSLYSMTGTLVSSGAFRSGDALSARTGVGPGMYVVSITNKKGEAYRAKLVVVP